MQANCPTTMIVVAQNIFVCVNTFNNSAVLVTTAFWLLNKLILA